MAASHNHREFTRIPIQLRCELRVDGRVLETRATGRPPIAVNAEAEKVKDAFNAAIEKLRRAVETDLGKLKDKNLRESVRGVDDSSTPADAAVA